MFIRRGRRSGTLALIALAALGLLTTLTNPVDNVIYTAFFFGLVLLMFRSAKSLSWVDGIILALIGFGLFFYISKRSY
jgi:apolipoprotein N-acyltransferase